MSGDEPGISRHNNILMLNIEEPLQAILSGVYETKDVNELVRVCHALAIPHIRKKLFRDTVLRENIRLNINDFAYDCIADLFAFGKTGEFPHFRAYFAAYPIEALTPEETISHLRRLVFSHANQGIFRLYNEADPILGKIIRNIKLAVQQFNSLKLVERFGEPCLVPTDGDPLMQLRSLERDELERGLSGYLHGNENVPYMLGKLALFLQEQTEGSRIVALSLAGSVFRSIYTMAPQSDAEVNRVEIEVMNNDLRESIGKAVEKIKAKMLVHYSRKKRIDAGLVEIYFRVIEARFNLTFSGDGKEKGLYELLKEQIADLTDAEYRKIHRSRLEYLSRLTGNEVTRILDVH